MQSPAAWCRMLCRTFSRHDIHGEGVGHDDCLIEFVWWGALGVGAYQAPPLCDVCVCVCVCVCVMRFHFPRDHAMFEPPPVRGLLCTMTDSGTPRSMAHLEEQHQREMIRIHELWQGTKEQLRNKTRELEEVRAQMKTKQDGDGVVGQMHALTIELRDKLRFTELQLAAAREEGSVLASQMEGMRHQLGDAQVEATEQRELYHRQVSSEAGVAVARIVAKMEAMDPALCRGAAGRTWQSIRQALTQYRCFPPRRRRRS